MTRANLSWRRVLLVEDLSAPEVHVRAFLGEGARSEAEQ